MKTVVMVVSLVVLLLVGFVASFKGLDLRKRSSWLYGVISFLCGIALGMSLSGGSGSWVENLKMGALFAILTLTCGAAMRRHKQKYNEDYVRSLLLKYGKEDDSSLFAKLVRTLLSRYK